MLDKLSKLVASFEKDRLTPVFPYEITDEPNSGDSPYRVSTSSPQLLEKVAELGQEIYKPNKKTPERLKQAIAKWPGQAQFYNYLAMAYILLKQPAKAQAANEKTYELFPDYLFARLAMAEPALAEKDFDQVRHYLGASYRLEDLYPDRKIFHTTEILNYYLVAGLSQAEELGIDQAQESLDILNVIDEDSPQAKRLSAVLMAKRMQRAQQNIEYMNRNAITLEDRDFTYENQTETPPAFHHAEMDWLYSYDSRLPLDKIKAILELPRQTLIEDLETVLEDGIRRFAYWNELEWDKHTQSFLHHAVILLGELRATQSLPVLLNQLRQGREYNDFWFGEWIDDIFQTPLYRLGREQLDVIMDFMQEPYIEASFKTQASKAPLLVVALEPERRGELIEWYRDLIRYFLDHADNEDLLDTDLLAYFIWDAADVGLVELIPSAREIYDRNLATLGVLGEWEEAKELFDKPKPDHVLNWYFEDGLKQYGSWRKQTEDMEKQDRETAERLAKRRELEALERAAYPAKPSGKPVFVEKIGRNERVTVKYPDGTMKKDVKYKTVEQDVVTGKGILV